MASLTFPLTGSLSYGLNALNPLQGGVPAIHAVIGDSIALGFNNGDPSAPYDEVVPNCLLWTGAAFEPLQGGTNNQSHGTGTGIVVGLGNRLATLQGKHYMVEYCVSGSTLASGWQTPSGTNYAGFKSDMTAALAAAPAGTKFKSVTIALGTNDSIAEASAEAVQTNFEALIADIKSEYAAYLDSQFQVCIVQVGDASGYNWIETAKFYERQVEADADNSAILIKTEGYAQWDSVHYTAAATIDIGIAAANAIHTRTSEIYQPTYSIAANASVRAWYNPEGIDSRWTIDSHPSNGTARLLQVGDSSGNNHDGAGQSIGVAPLWYEAFINNNGVMQVVSQSYEASLGTLNAPFSAVMMYRPLNLSARRFILSIGGVGTTTTTITLTHETDGTLSLYDGTTVYTGGSSVPVGDSYILWMECNTTGVTVRVNGIDSGLSLATNFTTNGDISVGAYAPAIATKRSNCIMGDIIILDEIPSSAVRLAIEGELLRKWDLNNAPVVANAIPDQSAYQDMAYSFQFASDTFSDADGHTLTYSATGLPSWLSFDAGTRTFSGTPTSGDLATSTITVTASDPYGASVSDSFQLEALDAIPPATLPTTPTARWIPQFSTVTTSGGRVVSATDLMGLADASEGASGVGPLELTDAQGRKFWRFNSTEYMNVASTLTGISNRAIAVFMVGRVHRTSPIPTNNIFGLGNVADGTAINTGNAEMTISSSGSIAPWLRSHGSLGHASTSNKEYMIAGSQMQVLSTNSRTTANGGIRLMINNKASSNLSQASISAPSCTGAEIGRYPFSPGSSGNWGMFDLYELVIYSGTLSNAEQDAIQAALTSYYSIPEIEHNMVLEGDSITQGTGDVVSGLSCGMVMTAPGAALIPTNWRVINMGTSGNQVSNLVSKRDATNGWPSALISGGNNIVAFEIGRNDFVAGGQTAASHYANVVAYLNTTTTGVLQRGWTVRQLANIATSGTSGTSGDPISDYRTLIRDAQYLTDTLTNTGQTYEGLLSIIDTDLIEDGGNTVFFDSTDAADTAYYAGDSTHPNIPGAELRVNGGDDATKAIAYGVP